MADVRCRLLALMVFAAAFLQLQAAPVTLAEFPFQFREGLLWVEVTLPQSEKPLNFLLDTGAGVSVINLSTAKRLGIKLGREVTVHGVETMLTGYWQRRMSAKVGNVKLPSEYLAFDLEKLSRSCERPVDGLVGADFFRGRVVQIDFNAQKIRMLKAEKAWKSDAALLLQSRPCGMRVPITVNGHDRQWVRLDTGCATALQWVTSLVPDQCTHQMAIGLAEISIPQTKTTVGIGEHKFESVPTGLHETAIFPGEAGLLGNGLLSLFSRVTIDAKAGRVILEKRYPAQ
ncbi:MAG: hypothetical protein DME22_10835 [Verrucomicrobia bacterium]|nr:MAG: hypothetical protein DME22_10835 [Verrucomicrobiota bacterium]